MALNKKEHGCIIILTCLVKSSQCMLILLIIDNAECFFFCTNDVTGISIKGTLVRLCVTVKWCTKAAEFSIIIIHMSIWAR